MTGAGFIRTAPTHDLAAWLAARQMFVALIVTAATMLAERDSIAHPIHLDGRSRERSTLKIFNLVWTTFTVLWFMQILPKHMAAINPDRYLKVTGGAALPVVNLVKAIGISWPAEKTAAAVQNLLGWHRRADPREGTAARRGPGRRLGRPDPGGWAGGSAPTRAIGLA